jgi:hypothetical protein
VSEDSDFDGPTDLFNNYDFFFDSDTLQANMVGLFIDDENTGKETKVAGRIQRFEIVEEGQDLEDWTT